MRARYDAAAKCRPIKVGDLVKVKVMQRKKGGKLKPRYIGPCRVRRQNLNSKNVFIVEIRKGVTKTLNHRMLAPWYERLKK